METNIKVYYEMHFLFILKDFLYLFLKNKYFLKITLRNKSSYNNNMDIYVKCKTLLSIKKIIISRIAI